MNDHVAPPDGGPKEDPVAAALLGKMLTQSMQKVMGQNEAQQIGLMAVTAMLVCSPHVAQIDEKKMAAVIYAMAGAKPETQPMVKAVAAYVSSLVGFAKKLPEAMAAIEAAEKAGKKPG
jgi:hypothetical protein